ncbi:erythromycin esterase family protein, partial [Streptomyces sp. NPDC005393]|uniref:erythromycin esterase family protein n=1 Tax=Streptomyces sp. NPDC005393 TaxID=3157041 RepID=UPI0033B639D0
MTRQLIERKGFCAVAAEADWPDAYRVNRYVRGRGDDTAEESLRGSRRGLDELVAAGRLPADAVGPAVPSHLRRASALQGRQGA